MKQPFVEIEPRLVDIGYGPGLRWLINCPYCGGGHYHGAPSVGNRVSHCEPGGQYKLVWTKKSATRLRELLKRKRETL